MTYVQCVCPATTPLLDSVPLLPNASVVNTRAPWCGWRFWLKSQT